MTTTITMRIYYDAEPTVQALGEILRHFERQFGPSPALAFPEEPGFEYRYYTDEFLQDNGLSADAFRRYIERGTTWSLVGHDGNYGKWVCRRPSRGSLALS